jgi:hypothetical protein
LIKRRTQAAALQREFFLSQKPPELPLAGNVIADLWGVFSFLDKDKCAASAAK